MVSTMIYIMIIIMIKTRHNQTILSDINSEYKTATIFKLTFPVWAQSVVWLLIIKIDNINSVWLQFFNPSSTIIPHNKLKWRQQTLRCLIVPQLLWRVCRCAALSEFAMINVINSSVPFVLWSLHTSIRYIKIDEEKHFFVNENKPE